MSWNANYRWLIRHSPSLETFKRSLKSHRFLQCFCLVLVSYSFVWQLWRCTTPLKWFCVIYGTQHIDYFTLHYITHGTIERTSCFKHFVSLILFSYLADRPESAHISFVIFHFHRPTFVQTFIVSLQTYSSSIPEILPTLDCWYLLAAFTDSMDYSSYFSCSNVSAPLALNFELVDAVLQSRQDVYRRRRWKCSFIDYFTATLSTFRKFILLPPRLSTSPFSVVSSQLRWF